MAERRSVFTSALRTGTVVRVGRTTIPDNAFGRFSLPPKIHVSLIVLLRVHRSLLLIIHGPTRRIGVLNKMYRIFLRDVWTSRSGNHFGNLSPRGEMGPRGQCFLFVSFTLKEKKTADTIL